LQPIFLSGTDHFGTVPNVVCESDWSATSSSGLVEVAVEAEVAAFKRFGDVENLPIVQAEVLYHLVDRIQA
jgi:hypothetical protein